MPRPRAADGRELKFNPYHDPDDGRFTFAPGGPRSLASVVVSDKRRPKNSASDGDRDKPPAAPEPPPRLTQAVYHPDEDNPLLRQVAAPRGGPPMRRGGNYEALIRPMTLEQVFPSLRNTAGGAIVAVADNLLDFTGPAQALTAELTNDLTDTLIRQITTVDPDYRLESVGFPQTLEGQMNQLNNLRFELAAALLRKKGDPRALQVETLRLMQAEADKAYEIARGRLRAGNLRVRLSNPEAIGNFIDRHVRIELRQRLNRFGIDSAGKGPVRVNRRENNSSATELTYRRPDARVANVAFDVSLTQKTIKTAQIRDFFATDFKPSIVIIIRPRQLGGTYTYAIPRPEKKQ
ncbi:hypothetical protein SCH01S_39_01110 [Sphingomonas changbaiensis NBRC 104936]|uniref:Uncharacterized protein n=1 Tax=Sphingomonas changbaiensis NBRC 104936 TaxID=1219043 RepID=A0A0E9MQU7_9SPHN|nr:hypothetical protein SCH01S_39_01110 [Sphingomonas changbaiensis NBRC 104936]